MSFSSIPTASRETLIFIGIIGTLVGGAELLILGSVRDARITIPHTACVGTKITADGPAGGPRIALHCGAAPGKTFTEWRGPIVTAYVADRGHTFTCDLKQGGDADCE